MGHELPRGHEFPRFDDSYRQRWVSAGLWADQTLHDLFDETVAERPDAVAVTTRDRRMTFAEYKAESDALAAGLLLAGVERGDIVAVQLPNWIEFCLLQIALSRIGAVIQPTHCVFRERELRSLLGFCDTDFVVVPDSFEGHGYANAVRNIRDDLPRLRKLIVARGDTSGGEGEAGLETLIDEGGRDLERLEGVTTDPDDVFYLNFTSGTEGNPKGFLHTHNTLISTFKNMSQALANLDPEIVNLTCSPMTHSFGHFTTYQCALAGIPMVLVDRYRPGDVLELIEQERATSISGTPAHLIGILHHPDFESVDTSSVKSVSVGGARSSPELMETLEAVWGVRSANTYGMGENIIHTRTMPWDPEDKATESVGRPLFGAELKIADPADHARELPPGEVGDIMFRGPTLFVAYHKQPELTAATRTDDGWFVTGDRGYVDDEGYLYFAGRAKEVINRGGTKIYPKAVEDLLVEHADIEEAAVVGMPDERLGERVCAYVVTRNGATADVEELRSFFAEQKAMKYLAPEAIVVVDELPMTPTGKIAKSALVEDAAERVRAHGEAMRGKA
ncbi:MAG: AMP-binding protein [Acidimicrobiia bacterium]|nr:AMP-binding protein [Acidimicrobiia bacterium]